VLASLLLTGCFDFGFEPGQGAGGDPSSSSVATAAGPASGSDASTGSAGVCGDGNVDTGEECDDRNVEIGDGCDGACRKESVTTSGGAGGGEGGAGGTGSTSGTGGEGGTLRCDGADLENDPDNCGACEFTCGTGACTGGRCGQSLVLDDLGYIKSILVVGDTLYIEQRDGAETDAFAFAGTIRTLPIDFDEDTVPGLNHPVVNAVGSFALGTVGARRVYFAGQGFYTEDTVYHPNPNVYACGLADCQVVALDGIPTQLNGLAAVGATLYGLDVSGGRLLSASIDVVTGVPGATTIAQVDDLEDDAYADGVITLQYLSGPPRIYWSTYDADDSSDGCIFRADTGELPLAGELDCFTQLFSAQGFIVASDGTIYGQNRDFGPPIDDTVFELAPDGSYVDAIANATYPRGVDETYLYVGDATTGAIRAIDRSDRSEAGRTEDHASGPRPYAMDASHPDYVFYVVGDRLYRWPKPRP